MPTQPKEIYTGIEIGTSTIKVAICSVANDYSINLLGWGEVPSVKVIKGEIQDNNFVRWQIKRAIDKAAQQANINVQDTYIVLAVGGRLVTLIMSQGTVDFNGMDLQITDDHIVAANRAAWNENLNESLQEEWACTRYFSTKDEKALLTPCGHVSTFLESHILRIAFKKRHVNAYATNVFEVIKRQLDTAVYTPIAVTCAVIPYIRSNNIPNNNNDAPSEGYLFIDIGAGVTSYALYTGMDFYTMGQITVGCDHVANDLAIAYSLHIDMARTILRDFENLKCSVIPIGDGRTRLITAGKTPDGTVKNISASSVEQIVQVRFLELFNIIDEKMEEEDAWRWATGGIILSGGGAKIPKIAELASNVFRKPVTIAKTVKIHGEEEIVSSPANLVPFGLVRVAKQMRAVENEKNPKDPVDRVKKFIGSMFNW